MGLNLEGGDSAGGEVGIEGLSEFEVDGAAGGKSSWRLPVRARVPWARRSVSSPVTWSGSRRTRASASVAWTPPWLLR